jgi:hypothetical protein
MDSPAKTRQERRRVGIAEAEDKSARREQNAASARTLLTLTHRVNAKFAEAPLKLRILRRS